MKILVKGDVRLEVWYRLPGRKGHRNSKKCFWTFGWYNLQTFISLILALQASILARSESSPSCSTFSSPTLSSAKRLRAVAASFHETSGKASASWGSILWVFIFVTFFLLPSAAWCSKDFASEMLEKRAKIKYSFLILTPYFNAGTLREVEKIFREHGFDFGKDTTG